jgi:hypothetical protein
MNFKPHGYLTCILKGIFILWWGVKGDNVSKKNVCNVEGGRGGGGSGEGCEGNAAYKAPSGNSTS